MESKPVIHGFYCSDHDPIEKWIPSDITSIDFWMDIYLGPDNNPSGEYFSVHVMSTKNIRNIRNFKNKKYILEIQEYSWGNIINKIDAILDNCNGNNWQEMTEKLRKYFYWEYEGMS